MPYRNVLKSSFEVKATGGGFIVAVCFELHASISEDGCMVSPGRFWQIDIMRTCVESSLQMRKKDDKICITMPFLLAQVVKLTKKLPPMRKDPVPEMV